MRPGDAGPRRWPALPAGWVTTLLRRAAPALLLWAMLPPAHAVWGDVATPAEIEPFERVSIVLASRNLKSPLSQFGHTFLVFHHHEAPEPSSIAVEYTGHIETWRDYPATLFGAVTGTFAVQYFSYKIRDYDLEDRSYWVYPLRLSPGQVRALKAALVGALGQPEPYGVFRQNCASYLIEQIAQATGRPYRRESLLFVTPDATVRWLRDEGLIDAGTYEPSTLMRARAAYRDLSPVEQTSVRHAIAGYALDPSGQRPQLADAISRYADYRIIRSRGAPEREQLFLLKQANAELPQAAQAVDPDAMDPSRSPGNATVGALAFGGGRGTRLWWRPGFIGPENEGNYGFADAVSEIFNLQARVGRSFVLEGFEVLRTESYVPGGFLASPFTQRLAIGYRDEVAVLGTRHREYAAEFGRGQTWALGAATVSVMPFASIRAVRTDGRSSTEARLAGRARLHADLARGLGASVSFDRYLNPNLGIAQRVEGRLDLRVSPRLGLGLDVRGINGWSGRHEIGLGAWVNF